MGCQYPGRWRRIASFCEKIILDRQSADLRVQPLDLTFCPCLGVLADLRVKRLRSVLLQLFLPSIDLVRMHLIALRQVGHRRLLAQRLQCDLRLQRRINLASRLRHHPLRLA